MDKVQSSVKLKDDKRVVVFTPMIDKTRLNTAAGMLLDTTVNNRFSMWFI